MDDGFRRTVKFEWTLLAEEFLAISRHAVNTVAMLLVDYGLTEVLRRTVSANHLPFVDLLFFWFMVAALLIFSFSCLLLLSISGLRAVRASWQRYRNQRAQEPQAAAGGSI